MKDPHVEEIITPEFPPSDHPDFPAARDAFVARIQPAIWKLTGYAPLWYQHESHCPPEPYASTRPLLKGLFGAKRIGKSYYLPEDVAPYLFVPGVQVRAYAPEHENAQREFSYLNRLIFTGMAGQPPLSKYFPWLKKRITRRQLVPREGALELLWGNVESLDHIQVLSRSQERLKQWVGEPIDYAMFCEPGLLSDPNTYDGYVKPNLRDRRGIAAMAGTVDYQWIHDVVHAHGHNPATNPDCYCMCMIHARENPYTFDQAAYELAKKTEDSRTLAINWMGLWGVFSNTAYDNFDSVQHVRSISPSVLTRMKRGLPGWERFLVIDVGRYMALSEWVVNTKGHLFCLEEYTNYRYRRGRIEELGALTFRPWLTKYLKNRYQGTEEPLFVLDKHAAVEFGRELDAMGLPHVPSVSDHTIGVSTVNEYFGRKGITINDSCENIIFELPRVKWSGRDSGVGGRQHLSRGHDHAADTVRYACTFRPPAATFERKRPTSVVSEDELQIQHDHDIEEVDEHMGMVY